MVRVLEKYTFNEKYIFVVNTIKNNDVFGCLINKEYINDYFVVPEDFIHIDKDKFNLKLFKNYRSYEDW